MRNYCTCTKEKNMHVTWHSAEEHCNFIDDDSILMHMCNMKLFDTVVCVLLVNPFLILHLLSVFLSYHSNRAVSRDRNPPDCSFEHQTGAEAQHERQTHSPGERLSSPVGHGGRLNNTIESKLERIWDESVATESDRVSRLCFRTVELNSDPPGGFEVEITDVAVPTWLINW